MGNGNYLGQTFEGVQPCPRCHGKGFLNADGTANNAFLGSDQDPVMSCPDCDAEKIAKDALAALLAASGQVETAILAAADALLTAAKLTGWPIDCWIMILNQSFSGDGKCRDANKIGRRERAPEAKGRL